MPIRTNCYWAHWQNTIRCCTRVSYPMVTENWQNTTRCCTKEGFHIYQKPWLLRTLIRKSRCRARIGFHTNQDWCLLTGAMQGQGSLFQDKCVWRPLTMPQVRCKARVLCFIIIRTNFYGDHWQHTRCGARVGLHINQDKCWLREHQHNLHANSTYTNTYKHFTIDE